VDYPNRHLNREAHANDCPYARWYDNGERWRSHLSFAERRLVELAREIMVEFFCDCRGRTVTKTATKHPPNPPP